MLIALLKSQLRSDLCQRASNPNNSLRCVHVTQNLKALGEQDVANSRHNDVYNFHSQSAILKIEKREEPQSFNAYVQPFLSPVGRCREVQIKS